MAVSEAIENYLETIYILSQQQNEVHAIDVCSYLSYSRPTVSIVLRQMRENGLVNVDEDNHIHLTEEGKRIATHIYERHTILSQLFMSLGVSKETALGISNALEIEPEELFDVKAPIKLFCRKRCFITTGAFRLSCQRQSSGDCYFQTRVNVSILQSYADEKPSVSTRNRRSSS